MKTLSVTVQMKTVEHTFLSVRFYSILQKEKRNYFSVLNFRALDSEREWKVLIEKEPLLTTITAITGARNAQIK